LLLEEIIKQTKNPITAKTLSGDIYFSIAKERSHIAQENHTSDAYEWPGPPCTLLADVARPTIDLARLTVVGLAWLVAGFRGNRSLSDEIIHQRDKLSFACDKQKFHNL